MNKQIRTLGSYEVVLYDEHDNRIKEIVSTSSLIQSREYAKELLQTLPDAASYTVSRIIDNSKFNNWMPKQPY